MSKQSVASASIEDLQTPELEVVNTDDTEEFDPWEKVLEALMEQRKDIKDIKQQIKTIDANIELIRHAYVDHTQRLSLLESDSDRRTQIFANVASLDVVDTTCDEDTSDSDKDD